jgi:hypothetical protein
MVISAEEWEGNVLELNNLNRKDIVAHRIARKATKIE